MNEQIVEQPKKSGGALKVVLVIITLISIVAAAAMGLLYYNAITNLELVREKNIELGEDRDKYKEQAAEYQLQITEFEQEVADLSKQLAEAQAIVETPVIAGPEGTDVPSTEGTTPGTETTEPGTETTEEPKQETVDLSKEKTLDVKPTTLYETPVEYKVTKQGINMRSGPSSNHRNVHSAYKGNVLTAYAEEGDWLCVKTSGGLFGWVRNDLVEKVQ